MAPPTASSRLARLRRWGWPRGFEIVQFPNPPLILALLAAGAARLLSGGAHRQALAVYYLALAVWAYEEAVRGSNWLRRLLGAGFLVYIALRLAAALR
jgi:hypothetical protein